MIWYLDLLRDGVEEVRRTDGLVRGYRDRSRRWKRSHRWMFGRAESAREVSDEWVRREEELALVVERDVTARDEEVMRSKREKTRRKSRKEVLKATGVKKADQLKEVHHPAVIELEKEWSMEAWGEEITLRKLATLDQLMMPEWSKWYSDRLSLKQDPYLSPSPTDTASTDRSAGRPTNKVDRIASVTAQYDELSMIPEDEGTGEQRAALAVIQNRKHNREKRRTKKLLTEGVRPEQIEAEGGADAVFAKREKAEQRPVLSRQTKASSATKSLDAASEHDVRQLKKIGLDRCLTQNGLEVFNFDRMSQLLQ